MRKNVDPAERDEEGYLRDPGQWSRALACVIAGEEGMEMDAERCQVVDFVRAYYLEHAAVPEARTVLKHLQASWGAKPQANKKMYALFPRGYGQQACKIARMRKPLKLMLDV